MVNQEPSFTTKLIEMIAHEEGYGFFSLSQNVDHYAIIFSHGKKSYGFQSILDINTIGSWRTVKSKIATHGFLEKYEYSTIPTIPLYQNTDIQEVEKIVTSLGFPCVIKPNSASRARGITVVKSIDDIAGALAHARDNETYGIVLAQPLITGRHMRFMVLDNETILVYEKPAFWASDDIIAIDVPIHDSYKIKIAQAVTDLGLIWSGVDVIIPLDVDIEKPLTKDSYMIVEINSAPTMKRFASLNQETYQQVKNWYKEILIKIQEKL